MISPNADDIVEAVRQGRVHGWPERTVTELFELAATNLDGKATVISFPEESSADLGAALAKIVRVVLALYPAWLPDASGIGSVDRVARTAVSDIARTAAANGPLFGPVLVRLAHAALESRIVAPLDDVPQEVVAAECGKLIRVSYKLGEVVLLIPAPPLAEAACRELERTALWLAQNIPCTVWLAGPASGSMPRITRITTLAEAAPTANDLRTVAVIETRISPLAGRPNPMSEIERRLEARLVTQDWANGRAWNITWQADSLSNAIRPDLMWAEEQCVVEIDGPEHLLPAKFAADRRRDRLLQLEGFAVLRFTNEEVANDVDQVATHIERFLRHRRSS